VKDEPSQYRIHTAVQSANSAFFPLSWSSKPKSPMFQSLLGFGIVALSTGWGRDQFFEEPNTAGAMYARQ